ncbi:MAG: hypothetical protein HY282_10090 [Nitrospirae bacterium]|nr:hypothetical protein [Candidatus Manganitrophaceae bacterium]
MALRLFYMAVLLALTMLFPFFPTIGLSAEGTTPAVAKAQKRKELEEIQGKILKIEPDSKLIHVGPKTLGRSRALKVSDQTEITIEGKPATFPELRMGDKVRIRYAASEGEKTAASIEVLS